MELRSSTLLNRGNFRFDLVPLPQEAQRSVVAASSSADINGDGNLDIVVGGNIFGLKPEMGRLGSSCGYVLLGDGKGVFRAINRMESGFCVDGEIRDIQYFQQDRPLLIVARNNKSVQYYQINE